jgi:hypothetical protein
VISLPRKVLCGTSTNPLPSVKRLVSEPYPNRILRRAEFFKLEIQPG